MPAIEPRETDTWNVQAAGHEFTLFVEIVPLVRAMIGDIRTAQQRAWLEVYTLADDASGRAVVGALAERAAAGLDVRVMIDAIGSLELPDSLLAELEHAGAKVHVFHSAGFALWQRMSLELFNRRNHRKLLVVDDRLAYFGGMNVVDPSLGQASAAWRDVHVRLEGPQTANVAAAMERLWNRCHHQQIVWPKWPIAPMLGGAGEGLYLFDSMPFLRFRRASRIFRPLIRRAKRSITLSMAYFIPQGSVLRELIRARRRGVRVRVIMPEHSDVPLVQWAARHLYAVLLKHGFHLYERRDRMLHGKVMIVDDRYSVIGSCNLDPRSLQWNLEFLGVVRSQAFARTTGRIVARELRGSQRVRGAHVLQRPWWQRLRDRLAWSFRRWL